MHRTTNLAVGNDDILRLARVDLLGSATAELCQNVRGGDLRVLGGLNGLLLLLPVYHVTDRIDGAVRRQLERPFDLDLPARIEHVWTE